MPKLPQFWVWSHVGCLKWRFAASVWFCNGKDIPMEPVFSDGFSPVDKGKIRIAAIACGCRQAIGRNVSERTGT